MSRDWETCSTNHENGVEDEAIHGRQPSKAEGEKWAEVTEVNSALRFGLAEINSSNHKTVKYRERTLNPSD